MRERNLLKTGKIDKPIITDPVYLDETIRKKYFKDLVHTVSAGLSALEDDSKRIEES